MFGYIIVNQQEMKFREYDCYRSYYCGLCRSLKERYGAGGQMTLSYDMTFLVMLLSALYEPDTQEERCRCMPHPVHSHAVRRNPFTDYAADMNLLLSYYKGMDDWSDERRLSGKATAGLLRKKNERISRAYPEKAEEIYRQLENIHLYEKTREKDPDLASGCFGRIMAEILAWRRDEWEDTLRRMGFYLGKFLYLMDAYEDMDRDQKSGSYNVFLEKKAEFPDAQAFERYAYTMLQMMMAECSRAFEKLPILENVEILRNILYSGVWSRYEMLQKKKEKR